MKFYKAWLEAIKQDVHNKYNFIPTDFFHNNQKLNIVQLYQWLNESLRNPNQWVKYSVSRRDSVNLCLVYPDPSENVCKKLVREFLECHKESKKFTLSYQSPWGEDIINDTVYTKDEIVGEVLYLLRCGTSHFSEYKKGLEDSMCHIWARRDSIPNLLDSGYLTLEAKHVKWKFQEAQGEM